MVRSIIGFGFGREESELSEKPTEIARHVPHQSVVKAVDLLVRKRFLPERYSTVLVLLVLRNVWKIPGVPAVVFWSNNALGLLGSCREDEELINHDRCETGYRNENHLSC